MDINIFMRVFIKKIIYPMFVIKGRTTISEDAHANIVNKLSFFLSFFSIGEENLRGDLNVKRLCGQRKRLDN